MRILIPVLVLILAAGAATQTSKPAGSARQSHSTTLQTTAPAVDQAEIDALRADLQRMNATLNQMRTNLGYVASTTQPLRHQFELEIDMWQLQLGQMQRRLAKLEAQR